METSLALLDEMKIRRTLHNNEWWFAVEDVVGALMDSLEFNESIREMRRGDCGLRKGWVQIVHTLFGETSG